MPRIHISYYLSRIFRASLVLCGLILPVICLGGSSPRLAREGSKFVFLVDDKPFFIAGAQVHNSSGWLIVMEKNWVMLKSLGVNTVEIPVYWETIEPEPGRWDFALVDGLIDGARQNGFRLVLLWFATWKNGVMDYAPAWVKENPQKYPRMLDRSGRPVRVLSPHSRENLEADKRAFTALMEHLREVDGDKHTVIMVQVQNEPGSLETDRDYSAIANRLFEGAAPDSLCTALEKKPGTWKQVFEVDAAETFAAYHVAKYVNEIAEAGKKVYPLPLYVNVWLREQQGFLRPGEAYPSGGATSNMLDVWKAAAPAIDLIAPDIYVQDYVTYRRVCQSYRRTDNPLFIPETGGSTAFARFMFYAIGDFEAIGVAPFGVDTAVKDGQVPDRLKEVAANFKLLRPAGAKILALQRAGKLRAAVEEDGIANPSVMFDRYEAVSQFGQIRPGYAGARGGGTPDKTGRVLIGQLGADEFLVIGFDARVAFRPRAGEQAQKAQFVTLEEGTFEEGQWKAHRILNGDEAFFGVALPPGGATLRVKLMSY